MICFNVLLELVHFRKRRLARRFRARKALVLSHMDVVITRRLEHLVAATIRADQRQECRAAAVKGLIAVCSVFADVFAVITRRCTRRSFRSTFQRSWYI